MKKKTGPTTNFKSEISKAELPPSLTPKEMRVLIFIEEALQKNGMAPTFQEIQSHFGFASINSVQNYLKQLTLKGYVHIPQNQKRAIQILRPSVALKTEILNQISTKTESSRLKLLQAHEKTLFSPPIRLPIMGRVAAGQPLERFVHDEYFDVPPTMVKNPDKTYVLKVEGDSMIEDGIFDGDLILVEKRNSVQNGDIIVASVENESTVKRYFLRRPEANTSNLHSIEGRVIELKPANSQMKSLWYSPEQVAIQGLVIGLIRQFI